MTMGAQDRHTRTIRSPADSCIVGTHNNRTDFIWEFSIQLDNYTSYAHQDHQNGIIPMERCKPLALWNSVHI